MNAALRSVFLPSICGAGFGWLSYLLLRPSRTLEGLIVASFVVSATLAACLAHQFSRRAFPLIVQCLSGAVALFAIWALLWATAEEAYIYWIVGPTILESGEVGFSRYIYPGNSGMGFADGFRRLPENLCWAVLWGVGVGLVSMLGVLVLRVITRKKPGQPDARSNPVSAPRI